MTKKLFLVTTEASGDLLGSGLVGALHQRIPELEVTGVGGDKLLSLGMDCIYHIRDFGVIGLFEVLAQLKQLKAKFNHLVARVSQEKPDVVVLIDAPDFNIRFAKAIRHLGIPIIYYVSPQIWAWRKKRGKQIAALVDHMMVLFSFEVEIYRELGLAATWVGHPLVDELRQLPDRESFFRENGFSLDQPLVALAPGSRNSEVSRLLPTMVEIARARSGYRFAMPLAPTVDPEPVRQMIGDARITIMPGQMRPLIANADAAVVASGTATLETGLLRTPLIVGYRLKASTYWLARLLVKVPHVALVNILLDKRVAPELIQRDFSPEKVLPLLDEMIRDPAVRQAMKNEFDRLEDILGGGGADDRAAAVIEGFL